MKFDDSGSKKREKYGFGVVFEVPGPENPQNPENPGPGGPAGPGDQFFGPPPFLDHWTNGAGPYGG